MSAPKNSFGATGNQTHGYFGGGQTPSSPSFASTMDKITYASDSTAAVPGANLTSPISSQGATGNSTHGYFGGGTSPFKING